MIRIFDTVIVQCWVEITQPRGINNPVAFLRENGFFIIGSSFSTYGGCYWIEIEKPKDGFIPAWCSITALENLPNE